MTVERDKFTVRPYRADEEHERCLPERVDAVGARPSPEGGHADRPPHFARSKAGRRWVFISGSGSNRHIMYIAKRGDSSSYSSLETWRVAGAPAQALSQGGDEERYLQDGSQEKVVRIKVRAAPQGESEGDTEAEAQRGTAASPKKKIVAILRRLTIARRSGRAQMRTPWQHTRQCLRL